jgi:hypothetical protein
MERHTRVRPGARDSLSSRRRASGAEDLHHVLRRSLGEKKHFRRDVSRGRPARRGERCVDLSRQLPD